MVNNTTGSFICLLLWRWLYGNGNSPHGNPLGMGIRHILWNGDGRKWECWKPFPHISSVQCTRAHRCEAQTNPVWGRGRPFLESLHTGPLQLCYATEHKCCNTDTLTKLCTDLTFTFFSGRIASSSSTPNPTLRGDCIFGSVQFATEKLTVVRL